MTQWGLDTLFNPAKRHMDEEKRRLQSTREQIGDASGGKRIDLESGKVTITRPKATAGVDEMDEIDQIDEGPDEGETPATEGDAHDASATEGPNDQASAPLDVDDGPTASSDQA